ncbi:MAG: YARHG domain-containing protein [Lachnospiraceae bacterium]|nr:YARHG domain-containing protein [Lachnospiraceae bacterium]
MKRKNAAVAVLMMTLSMGILSGCQGTLPPDGYNCKTGATWNTTGSYTTSSGTTYSSTGNYRTSLDTGEGLGSNWSTTSGSTGSGTTGLDTSINWTTTPGGNGTTIDSVTGIASAAGETDGGQSGSADSYMLTESNVRYYSEEELADLTLWELKVARNEIYARHGVIFEESAIQEHFNTRSWYHGAASINVFDDSVFNEYERANIQTIQKVEAVKSAPGVYK